MNHFKVTNSSTYQWQDLRLDLDLGFQRNFREEWSQYVQHGYMPATFPETLEFLPDLERQFEKYVYAAKVKLYYPFSEQTEFNFGVNSDYQDNRIDGRGFIIPAFQQLNAGAFVYLKQKFSKVSSLQAGLRYDYGNINTVEYQDWFPSPIIVGGDTSLQHLQRAEAIDRTFSNWTWSVGYNYNPGKWSWKINAGKSFRIPIAKELAANGVNYHHFSYEVGDADLSPEISYQLDAGVDFRSDYFAIGMSPFLNYFSNYIYLNPTAEHDRLYGNGNQVYNYTQSEVLRYGAELHLQYFPTDAFELGLVGDYVYSEQLSGAKKGFSLPFSPPPSAILSAKYKKAAISFMRDAYVGFDFRMTAAQNNIVPPEEPTAAYQLFNLVFGGEIKMKRQSIRISGQIQNLFNTKYFNHTSYYRLINVPEAGRNIILNISIPFSGKIDKKKNLNKTIDNS